MLEIAKKMFFTGFFIYQKFSNLNRNIVFLGYSKDRCAQNAKAKDIGRLFAYVT